MLRSPPRPDLLARLRPTGGPWHGPPPRLPALLDRASERWFGLPPRARGAVLVAGAVALLLLAGAGAARSPWGAPVPVLVLAVDVDAGETVTADHVRVARRPAGLVPDDALRALGDVATPRAAGMLLAGTVLTTRHLAGDDPVTGGLAEGRAAYPVATAGLPRLRAGHRLDLVAGDLEGRGRTLARDVRVVVVTGDTAWLDVAREEAPAIAAAALRDGLSVVLLAP